MTPGKARRQAPALPAAGAAGYSWCGKEQRCERPWELAAARGFSRSAEAFRAYCAASPAH